MEYIYPCHDEPDENDFLTEEIFGIEPKPIGNIINIRTRYFEPYDQGNSVKRTAYSLTGIHEIMNEWEYEKDIELNPDKLWEIMVKQGLTSSKGSSLQNALKTLLKYGSKGDEIYKIVGYAKVDNISLEKIFSWLTTGYPIYTGALYSGNKILKNKGYYDGGTSGHAFFIIGCDLDNRELLAINSYGKNWGYFKDGTFKIKEKDLERLFTSYIIYDGRDPRVIIKFEERKKELQDKIIKLRNVKMNNPKLSNRIDKYLCNMVDKLVKILWKK